MRGKTTLVFALLLATVAHGFSTTLSTTRGGNSAFFSALKSTASSSTDQQQELIDDLLSYARKIGPVGSLATPEEQEEVLAKAKKLQQGDVISQPARESLRGIHNLVYSAAPGGSSGRLFGPVYGQVTQEFLDDDKTFINSVTIGPIEISLQAEKIIKDDTTNVVKFRQSRVKLFGNTVVEKDITGGGAWKYLYMGKVVGEDGKPRLLRVMETPSLFVIEQPLQEE